MVGHRPDYRPSQLRHVHVILLYIGCERALLEFRVIMRNNPARLLKADQDSCMLAVLRGTRAV